jgi:hypothetical protein
MNENDELTEDGLAADLAAAWDEAEAASPQEEDNAEPSDITGIDAQAATDDQAADKPEDIEASAGGAEEADRPEGGQEPVENDSSNDSSDTAPSSLPPAAREAWKDTPPAMKEAIAKRERDFQVGIQKYAESAKRAQAMDATLRPYAQYLQMNGGPSKAIQSLLNAGAGLQMGAPAQKAQIIHNLITQFGVDVGAVDNLLTGQAVPQEVQQQSQMEQMLNQRLGPLQQQLQAYQQRDQQMAQQQQGKVYSEVEQFATDPKNEFYKDVSGDMADLMDMAAKRGRELSMADAYDRACQMHPEVSKIIAARNSAQDVQRKRQAASSVSGTPGGPGAAPEHDDVRSAIEAAWATAGRT